METGEKNHPRVVLPPPLIVGAPLALGMLLQWIFPLRFLPRAQGWALGALFLVPAVVLWGTARAAFRRAGTSMLPTRRSRVLIVDGPFRFTRNPLYAAIVLFVAGASLAASAAWPLFMLPVTAIGLHFLAVLPEEHYLKKMHGDVYCSYMKRVRRWL